MERARVAIIIFDASEGITAQDAHIAGYAEEARRSIILVANKWDLLADDPVAQKTLRDDVRRRFVFTRGAAFLTVSAKTGLGIDKILPEADAVARRSATKISTGELNRVLKRAFEAQLPKGKSGRELKIRYAVQVASEPPLIRLFSDRDEPLHFSFERFLQNRLREHWDLAGVPLKFVIRKGDEGPREHRAVLVDRGNGNRASRGRPDAASSKLRPDPQEEAHRVSEIEATAEARYKVAEVCRLADVQPYVLKYWESEFPVLAAPKGGGGPRLYSGLELKIIERIKKLLYDEGYTIAGAKKRLEAELKEQAAAPAEPEPLVLTPPAPEAAESTGTRRRRAKAAPRRDRRHRAGALEGPRAGRRARLRRSRHGPGARVLEPSRDRREPVARGRRRHRSRACGRRLQEDDFRCPRD